MVEIVPDISNNSLMFLRNFTKFARSFYSLFLKQHFKKILKYLKFRFLTKPRNFSKFRANKRNYVGNPNGHFCRHYLVARQDITMPAPIPDILNNSLVTH